MSFIRVQTRHIEYLTNGHNDKWLINATRTLTHFNQVKKKNGKKGMKREKPKNL